MKYIRLETIEQTTIVTISREKSLNALNLEVLKEIDRAFDEIDINKSHSVIITGAGRKAFVAGADIGFMKDFTAEQAREFTAFGSGVFRKIETFPIPVIAAVNGYALGGGLEFALACDIRIASENAVFGLPELGFGIIPGFGGTQRLMRIIPIGNAKEMMYTSSRIDSAKALQLGLVNAVFPGDELMEHAFFIAKRIAKNSKEAVRNAKRAMNEGREESLEAGLGIESDLFSVCFEKADQRKRMEAFLNKKR